MWFFGLLACLGAVAGAFTVMAGFASAHSAPQEAAAAALAVALAVIPYVFFRALQIVSAASETREFERQVLSQLREIAERKPAPASVQETQALAPAQSSAPLYQPKVVQTGDMGAPGWSFKRFDDGTFEVTEPSGSAIHYPSFDAARQELTWWRTQASS